MKTNAKRLKAIGRKYAKQAFHLTENDFVELSMLERAYLNGYKRCLKELKEIATDDGDVFYLPITEVSLANIVSLLKDNLCTAIHADIDREAQDKDYEALLKYLEAVDYTVRLYKTKLKIAIMRK